MSDVIKYFVENGLEASKQLIELGFGFCSCDGGLSFHTDQLKEIIEAWELVQSIGGLVKAKCNLDSVKYNLNAGLFYGQEKLNMQAHVERLHDAIAIVEEVESLKGEF